MKTFILYSICLFAVAAAACEDSTVSEDNIDNSEYNNIHNQPAPLYWSIYEYCYQQSQNGVSNEDIDFTEQQWDEIIEWVAQELKPYGYDMTWKMRDLWLHEDIGETDGEINLDIPGHGCRIIRLTKKE